MELGEKSARKHGYNTGTDTIQQGYRDTENFKNYRTLIQDIKLVLD